MSVVNSPIVVELLIITALFCVVLPAGSTKIMTEYKILIAEFARIIKEFGRKRRHMFEENLTFRNKSTHTVKENVGLSNVKLSFVCI